MIRGRPRGKSQGFPRYTTRRGSILHYQRTDPREGHGLLKFSLGIRTDHPMADIKDVVEALNYCFDRRWFDVMEEFMAKKITPQQIVEVIRSDSGPTNFSLIARLRSVSSSPFRYGTMRDAFLKDREPTMNPESFRKREGQVRNLSRHLDDDFDMRTLTVERAASILRGAQPPIDGDTVRHEAIKWKWTTQKSYKGIYAALWKFAIRNAKSAQEGHPSPWSFNPWEEVRIKKQPTPSGLQDALPFDIVSRMIESEHALIRKVALIVSVWVAPRSIEMTWMKPEHMRRCGDRYVLDVPSAKRGIPIPQAKMRTGVIPARYTPDIDRYLEMIRDSEWLFPSPSHQSGGPGTRLNTESIRRWTKNACEAVGISYGRPDGFSHHQFRHTTTTHLLKAGMSVEQVATMLGNNSKTVMTYYNLLNSGHLIEQVAGHQDAALEKLDAQVATATKT